MISATPRTRHYHSVRRDPTTTTRAESTNLTAMDKSEIVKLVSSKTGLDEQTATTAVDTVLGYIKQKLPPEIGGQLDALLSGQQDSGTAGILGAVQGLFGKKE